MCEESWNVKPSAKAVALIRARRHLKLEVHWYEQMSKLSFEKMALKFLEKKMSFGFLSKN